MKFTYSSFLLVFCAVLILSNIANSQNINQQGNANVSSPQNIQLENQNVNNEVSLLKAQNDLLRQHNEEMMTTVQWTINTFIEIIIGVVIVVIGLGWYTNFRAYDKDYKNLERDIKSELNSIRELLKIYEQQAERIIKMNFMEFKIDIEEEQYKRLTDMQKKQSDWNKQTYKIVDKAMDSRMSSIEHLISDVNYKFAVMQSEQNLEKDLLEDALSVYAEAISNEHGFKNKTKIYELLKRLESILERNEKQLSKYIINKIKRNLAEVSEEYKYEVEHIKELLEVEKNKSTNLRTSEMDDNK